MPSLGDDFNLLVTGSTHNGMGYRKTSDPKVHRTLVTRIFRKILAARNKIIDYELTGNPKDALIVCYGSTSRSALEAIDILEEKGIKAGVFRPKTLNPFPDLELIEAAKHAKVVLVPELCMGQLILIVERILKKQVVPLQKIGGGEPIYPDEIVEKIIESLR